MSPSHSAFRRTALLLTLYALLGLWAYAANMIAPAVPYLRLEFGLDYTFAALHISAFALGMILCGVFASRMIQRFGSVWVLWGGMGGLLFGLVVLVLAPNPYLSLAAIFFMGVTGTFSLTVGQATISKLYPEHHSKALLEMTVVASLTAAAAPFVIILGSVLSLGWRAVLPAFALALGVVAALGFRSTREVDAHPSAEEASTSGRLPGPYWIGWSLLVLGVSVEWCVVFWSAEYLKGLPEKSLELAAAGPGVFLIAALLGRVLSSRLAGRFSERRILVAAILLVLLGFPLYWLRRDVTLSYLGLAFCGLGTSNFYPLAISLGFALSAGQLSRASSMAAVGTGLAIFSAPLVLGGLADSFGLQRTLWAIPILLVAMALLLFVEWRHGATKTVGQ